MRQASEARSFYPLPHIDPPRSSIELARAAQLVPLPITKGIGMLSVDAKGYPWTLRDISELAHSRRPRPLGFFKTKFIDDEDVGTFLEVIGTTVDPFAYVSLVILTTAVWPYLLYQASSAAPKPDIAPNLVRVKATPGLVKKLRTGCRLVSDRRFGIALRRWGSSFIRADPLDSVLDCCSALEAVARTDAELRLRLSLIVRHLVPREKKDAARTTYEMYGLRNKFAHGSGLPTIQYDRQYAYIALVSRVLLLLIRRGKLPSSEDLDQALFG
jgi:hypothetical protein